jgi:hypothetical protein
MHRLYQRQPCDAFSRCGREGRSRPRLEIGSEFTSRATPRQAKMLTLDVLLLAVELSVEAVVEVEF